MVYGIGGRKSCAGRGAPPGRVYNKFSELKCNIWRLFRSVWAIWAGQCTDLAEVGWCCKLGQYIKLNLWNEIVCWARGSSAPWFRRVLAVNCLNLPASVRAFSEFSGQFGCRPVCKLAYSIRDFLHWNVCSGEGQRRAVLLLDYVS